MSIIFTLGDFLREELERRKMSNRALAIGAGVSEFAIRNMLQHGNNPRAKDPDPRTLRAVADYLQIDVHRLFRLAGYLPPARDAHSIRAELLADVFDRLPREKQDAILKFIEAFAETYMIQEYIESIETNPSHALDGFDLGTNHLLRRMSHKVFRASEAENGSELNSAGAVNPTLSVLPNITWASLPESARRRVLGLTKAKLNLEYDPTMVDPKWRG